MEKKVLLSEVYVYYRDLFTDKQQEYFDDYYLNDLSLGEIADNYGVSRNAIFNQIKIVEERLDFYEKVIGLKRKREEVLKLLKNKVDQTTYEKIEDIL
ncbi:MAG: hypothetical protein IKQ35_05285 [Bacilli bacterium]|nr:hypothetical protein [Bacilli bacterium]